MLNAERIACALQDRVFSLDAGRNAGTWRGLLLTAGYAEFRLADGNLPVAATSFAWTPWNEGCKLWMSAGSVGVYFAISARALDLALGLGPETQELRSLTFRTTVAAFDHVSADYVDIENAFSLILRESRSRNPAAAAIVSGQVRTLLALAWRKVATPTAPVRPLGRSEALIIQFRQLVEANFREHWTVSMYARKLGVSADRLHDVCTSSLGCAPKSYVSERIMQEIRLMLENTTLSIDQISTVLGFRDAQYFSRFVKQRAGQSPSAIRKRLAGDDSAAQAPESYEMWP